MRRTQDGNNNAYCQDNETSWFDWALVDRHADVCRFVKLLIARRLLRDNEPEGHRMTLTQLIGQANKAWHGVKLSQPDWSDHSHCVAFSADLPKEAAVFHLMFNAYWEPLEFELPPVSGAGADPWRRWIDTSLESPHDIVEWQTARRRSLATRIGPAPVGGGAVGKPPGNCGCGCVVAGKRMPQRKCQDFDY